MNNKTAQIIEFKPAVSGFKKELEQSKDFCTHQEAWADMDGLLLLVSNHLEGGGSIESVRNALDDLRTSCRFRSLQCLPTTL